jgi:predicted enzyme related to lactoylglutathione lyase
MQLAAQSRTVTTLLLMLLGITSGFAQATNLPPINSPATAEYHPGKFIWGDLHTDNPSMAAAFYTALFGWTAQTVERTSSSGAKPYIILSNGDQPVAGVAFRPKRVGDEGYGRWLGYVSVPDVAQARAAVAAAGGRLFSPPKNLPDRGTQALFADAEGAILGLMHSSTGDPGEYLPQLGDWTWAELFARDPAAASRFYHGVIGYEPVVDNRGDDGHSSFVLVSGGYSRASVNQVPARPKAHPVWLLFVRVAHIKDTVALAVSLGGRVVVPPGTGSTGNWRAVIADPTGAHLGVVELDEPAPEKKQP